MGKQRWSTYENGATPDRAPNSAPTNRSRAKYGALALITAVSLLAACGQDTGATSTSATAQESLHLVTGGASANQSVPYLAEVLGYAEEEGLDLTVKSVDANVLNIIVSGQADVAEIGSGTALVPVKDGKDTAIIYALGSGSATGFVAGSEGVTSIDDCKRLSTHKAGSSAFSAASAYKRATGASFEIVEYGNPPDVVASVLSGHSNCAVSSLGILSPGLEKGLHLIIDPRDETTLPPDSVQNAVGVSLWGMKAHMESKRSAVEKLMRATTRVQEYLKTATPEQVAAELVKHEDFKANDVKQLAVNVAAETPLFFPNDGYIDEKEWPKTLRFYSYGLPFIQPDEEIWSFSKRVDMSYHTAANGTPKGE